MPKFLIGDIVTIVTHPFTAETSDVVISGEYQMTPPLMMVTEIIDHSTDTQVIADKYKCLWFSTRENQLKESYLLETDLKKITYEADSLPIMGGSLVVLKSSPLELGKRRSFLNKETQQSSTKNTNSIAGLLTFISPVMTVLEVTIFDKSKDKKTSAEIQAKKIYTDEIAKCKWFNAVDEKFSECWIPLSCLTALPDIPHDMLALIKQTIDNLCYLTTDSLLIRPEQISNRSGYYYLTCFDYVLNQNRTIPVDELIHPHVITNPFKDYAPLFKKVGRKTKELKIVQTVKDIVEAAITSVDRNYLVIKYKDKFNNFTNRTISNYELIMGPDEDDPAPTPIEYVRAYCHTRKADRNFKLRSIIEVSVLDLTF